MINNTVPVTRDGGSPPERFETSIFAEVDELELRLESRRSPVEMLVIDEIARVPTEN